MSDFENAMCQMIGNLIAIFLYATIWAFLGGVSAWVASLFFGNLVLSFLSKIGITGFSMFEVGAILGFFVSLPHLPTIAARNKTK